MSETGHSSYPLCRDAVCVFILQPLRTGQTSVLEMTWNNLMMRRKFWRMRSAPLLLLPGPLLSGVVVPVRVPTKGQIEIFDNFLYLKPFNCANKWILLNSIININNLNFNCVQTNKLWLVLKRFVEKRKISYFGLARNLIQHWISPNQDDLSYSARTFISG